MYVVNKTQMKYVRDAYDNMKNIISKCCPGAKVEIEINEFNDGSASIYTEVDDIVVQNVHEFISIIEHSSNFEMYPLNNGNIKFTVTFNDVMDFVR
jgi:hypothetical protein